ncbi:MAG: 2-hydroxyhepta-2,4-diene-1,7-dioate isomerase [Rhizobiales bacterium]|nr:2-hydroxyhepta-2,4-diene-1,7-dioate isomerase [Hyphomicrobiales bacterium]
MKLLRYGACGRERPGILGPDGVIRDLSGAIGDLAGATVSLSSLGALEAVALEQLPEVEGNVRIGACLADAPNLHCIGLNYRQHAMETGLKIPVEPILFSKATSSISGPYDPVVIPKDSEKTDWECELGVVIGRDVEHISEAVALEAVSGYLVFNDVSERAFQIERSGQWVKGKSAPTFAPIGPFLVTADEVPDPQNLGMWLTVNGDERQRSNTSDMIFSVAEIISYMSRFMRLRAGDVIATGTPAGVGLGMKPPQYLKPGDVMALGIDGLGEQRQDVVAYGARASA